MEVEVEVKVEVEVGGECDRGILRGGRPGSLFGGVRERRQAAQTVGVTRPGGG